MKSLSISLEQHKEIQVGILLDFAKFCEDNNLKYFIAYGTLLGAVRHKGFIPWDDDIDVWMPRKDYNFLIKNYKSNLNYRLINPRDNEARHPYVKIIDSNTVKIEKLVDYSNGNLGVDIDVFPLDGQPDDDTTFVLWYKKLIKIYKNYLYNVLKNGGSVKRRIFFPILKFFAHSRKWVFKKADMLHALYPFDNSMYVGTIESTFDVIRDRFCKEWFEDSIMLEFESYRFRAPRDYDKILTQLYGDYMTLPPVEKQKTHHGFQLYTLDEYNSLFSK